MISITENTPINNINITNRLTKNSFLKLSMAFQLIRIHIGINIILKVIKKMDIPSTVIRILPQFTDEDFSNQFENSNI